MTRALKYQAGVWYLAIQSEKRTLSMARIKGSARSRRLSVFTNLAVVDEVAGVDALVFEEVIGICGSSGSSSLVEKSSASV